MSYLRDTTVALGRQILGKPADADEARAFCKMSGRRYQAMISCCEKADLAEGLRKHRQNEGAGRC